jgi:hypothetical protein
VEGKSTRIKQRPLTENTTLLQSQTTGNYERRIHSPGSCSHSYKRQGGLFDFPIHQFHDVSLISSTTAGNSAVPLSKIILFLCRHIAQIAEHQITTIPCRSFSYLRRFREGWNHLIPKLTSKPDSIGGKRRKKK